MNRRAFLGTLLGAGAAVALPSEVWPFKKIFLPTWNRLRFNILNRTVPPTFANNGILTLREASLEAVQLEWFQKKIPDLLFKNTAMFARLMNSGVDISGLATTVEVPSYHMMGLNRMKYPGPLITNMRIPVRESGLHRKATPENIERWIDELVPKSQG